MFSYLVVSFSISGIYLFLEHEYIATFFNNSTKVPQLATVGVVKWRLSKLHIALTPTEFFFTVFDVEKSACQ